MATESSTVTKPSSVIGVPVGNSFTNLKHLFYFITLQLESGVIAIWKTQCELVKNLVRFMLWNACARAACGVSHFVEFSGFSDIVKICAQHRENKVLPFFEVSI